MAKFDIGNIILVEQDSSASVVDGARKHPLFRSVVQTITLWVLPILFVGLSGLTAQSFISAMALSYPALRCGFSPLPQYKAA